MMILIVLSIERVRFFWLIKNNCCWLMVMSYKFGGDDCNYFEN